MKEALTKDEAQDLIDELLCTVEDAHHIGHEPGAERCYIPFQLAYEKVLDAMVSDEHGPS